MSYFLHFHTPSKRGPLFVILGRKHGDLKQMQVSAWLALSGVIPNATARLLRTSSWTVALKSARAMGRDSDSSTAYLQQKGQIEQHQKQGICTF